MGKKRIAKKKGYEMSPELRARALARIPKRRIATGTLFVRSTYNNTRGLLTDKEGNAIASISSGGLGFKGAKKGTPYAAAKVGELLGDKAKSIGVTEVDVVVRGVGSGRESVIRAFSTKGIAVSSIADKTPIPHNGPKPPKPRRV
ncbi:30S ribosomal protein S11 [bacterium]|nr:30S ribosomal protein S11 [bacterium]MCI0565708.1 30S ribosomal protein S11 [bacterium]MCI0679975.1 30S ribosomal protein S11 [bacterium]